MRFAKKFLAVLVACVCLTATTMPAMAATSVTETVTGETKVASENDAASAAVSYVTYQVYPYDGGGGTIFDGDYTLRIPTSVNLNGNFNGRFEYENLVDGWTMAGDGYLDYHGQENGYHVWGLNTWWVLQSLGAWKYDAYRKDKL